jgi:osmotically inducible protein OsmC
MPLAQRSAQVVWNGNLTQGNGTITAGSSGAFKDLPVTFASRTESPEGKTSPEELLASAHAICYAMVIANTLNKAGTPPQQLTVNAVCSLDRVEGGLKITAMDLDIRGNVPGIEQATFARTAREGEQACPVSNALRGNVAIRVNATLEQ